MLPCCKHPVGWYRAGKKDTFTQLAEITQALKGSYNKRESLSTTAGGNSDSVTYSFCCEDLVSQGFVPCAGDVFHVPDDKFCQWYAVQSAVEAGVCGECIEVTACRTKQPVTDEV